MKSVDKINQLTTQISALWKAGRISSWEANRRLRMLERELDDLDEMNRLTKKDTYNFRLN